VQDKQAFVVEDPTEGDEEQIGQVVLINMESNLREDDRI